MATLRYKPIETGLPAEVLEEFRRLSTFLVRPAVVSLNLAKLNAQPAKYQDGDMVYADGTNWNPGSGEGIYVRYGGAWNKL